MGMFNARPTRDDVVWGYSHILGRAPESEYAIQSQLKARSLQALIVGLVESAEFRNRVSTELPRVKQIDVQSKCSPLEMQQLRDRVRRTWEQLGQESPHFSVLTDDEYLPAEFKDNEEKFWLSGAADADDMRAACERSAKDFRFAGTCIELGCGVGRVSPYLARMFDSVIALDISEPHLEIARAHARDVGATNIDFINVSTTPTPDVEASMFFSRIVLQHSSPPIIRETLENMLSHVKSGGAALFQVPTFMEGYSFKVSDYLASEPVGLEMHCLPQQDVFEILAKTGFRPCEVRQTDDLKRITDWVSNTFFAVKM